MDETTELRPAPRHTPTGVVWLMAVAMPACSGWLVFGSPDDRQAIDTACSGGAGNARHRRHRADQPTADADGSGRP
jgi:hypothetical protein